MYLVCSLMDFSGGSSCGHGRTPAHSIMGGLVGRAVTTVKGRAIPSDGQSVSRRRWQRLREISHERSRWKNAEERRMTIAVGVEQM